MHEWFLVSKVIVVLLVMTGISGLLFHFWGRYIYTYQLRETGIVLILLRIIPVRLVSFKNIAAVSRIRTRETFFLSPFRTLRLGNRLWGDGVIIQPRHGLFSAILVTPDNADAFVAAVSRRTGDVPLAVNLRAAKG